MSYTITTTTKALTKQTKQEPMLILEIEGIGLIFGTAPILEFIKWDSGVSWDDIGLRWDSSVEKENSRQ
mgnify:CR=1 FL=1